MHRLVTFLALSMAAPLAAAAAPEGWLDLRGPDLAHLASPVFPGEGFGLELEWKVPLGSAYSSIAVVDGKAVTMYADAGSDYLVGLDAASGRRLWRYRMGDTYKGHDGSDDGPLSSPVVDGGVVFGVGPFGQLFAVKLADGSEVWSRSIEEELGGKSPNYGYSTTPVLEGRLLIVQTGGPDGHSLTALDRATGEVVWAQGDDGVSYQSPVVLDLLGRRQLVVVTRQAIHGVIPETGETLWSHEHPEDHDPSKSMAIRLGQGRFLVAYREGAVAYELVKAGDAHEVREVFRTREFGGSYAGPVLHEGNLYGFTGEFLTCVNAATGERAWKSRPPGGRTFALVDGRLVILGKGGVVVVADATPEGFRERARLETLERGSLTRPSFGNGKLYVRNLTQMAGIAIGPAQQARPEEQRRAQVAAGRFAGWVKKVETSEDKDALIREFLADQETFPLVEDDRWVHFVYQGDVEDLAIGGSMIESQTFDGMVRIDGTDFYYRSYPIEPGARWDYRFQVDFEDEILDPRNPRVSPDLWDDTGRSVVATSGYASPDFLDEPEAHRRGRVDTFELDSEILGNKRGVSVYLPAGYDESKARYPVLVVSNGKDWIEKGKLPTVLDNLIGGSVEPVVVVFVHRVDGQWWQEEGGSSTGDYARMLATELVPQIDGKYRTRTEPGQRAVMGADGGGFVAAYAQLRHPDVFGKAAVQSIQLDAGTVDELLALIAGKERPDGTFYVDWNRYEDRNLDRGYDYAAYSRRFVAALEQAGYTFTGGEANDSTGWASWRSRTDDVLEAFFPLR
jgi:enterochelin esterase-like enzyme/outer membrane protein assembly factor BamB